MVISETLLSTNTFSNPFEEINANVIDSKTIVDYWCNPFSLGLMSNFDEHKFCTSKIPIILQGSRGSGKTTILKYYSFPAQVERTAFSKSKSIIQQIKREGEVGFYYRCEESFVSTFVAIFQNVSPNNWTKIFECYIELIFSEKILEMCIELIKRGEVNLFPHESIERILFMMGVESNNDIYSIEDLYDLVHRKVLYFEQYKNRIIFTNEAFEPDFFVDIFSLSKIIISEIKSIIPEFNDVLFVLMIDEYENLNNELQKRFNTIIKFAKHDISIRVGKRKEGRFTTETINNVEYLRENHDYYLASLDQEQNINTIKKYFSEVANLRFRKSDITNSNTPEFEIINMLGDMEDYLSECIEVCDGRKNHLDAVLKQTGRLSKDKLLRERIIQIIKNDENPIAETINALWVIRAKDKNYLDNARYAARAMNAFFSNTYVDGVRKYKADYSNKYRYAITVFICSVYKKDKLYYGFNALSHISNGNIRTFINFCQSVVNEALFYEKDNFLNTGKISKDVQSHAINNYSRSEFDSICSVVFAGDKIRNLVLNVGNSFGAYHKDQKIRYPETTQFVLDETKLYPEDYEILKTAESWSIIIRRTKVQRASAGINERTELYHINKMFSPLFNMSYRTRGGVNLQLSPDEIHAMLHSDFYLPESVKKLIAGQEIAEPYAKKEDNQQLSLFDMRIENDEQNI